MKNHPLSLLFVSACAAFLFSCTKKKNLVTRTAYIENSAIYKSVTKEEYLKATVLERRFIDQIDGAVNALDIMKKTIPNRNSWL